MDELLKMLDEKLKYIEHKINGDQICIFAESTQNELACPYCGWISDKVHSRYQRSFQDLPIQGKKVMVMLTNRKMICINPKCKHTTFAEKYDFLEYKGKKTKRLKVEIINLSLNCSSVTASKILKKSVANVSKSTICNMLKKR